MLKVVVVVVVMMVTMMVMTVVEVMVVIVVKVLVMIMVVDVVVVAETVVVWCQEIGDFTICYYLSILEQPNAFHCSSYVSPSGFPTTTGNRSVGSAGQGHQHIRDARA